MKSLPKIAKCKKCGSAPTVDTYSGDGSSVNCAHKQNDGSGWKYCWSGPTEETPLDAIVSWNKVMEV